jgi:ferredoxin
MPLDRAALAQALTKTPGASPDGIAAEHSVLCRREAAVFQRAAKAGDDLVVACTQEAPLFLALNEQTEGALPVAERPIRFVNIRETGGWSKDAAQATPKLAALIAAAQRPDPAPVSTVAYRSAGRALVIGDAPSCERAAALLGDGIDTSLLVTGGALSQQRSQAVYSGRLVALKGWLGAFDAVWESGNPIDLELCTRCNACVDACPEGAIGFDYQVDLAACRSHRDCVRVCEAAGAIDFARAPQTVEERFDLVLDLRAEPAFTMHAKPQGYLHAPTPDGLVDAALKLRELVGTFDKPKFFQYRQKLCAHSRNEQIGCRACIDVCSAQAISSDASSKGKSVRNPTGGGIVVEPHLCVGCGACSTVCPSGALGFAYPNPADQGARIRTLLAAYRHAGGQDAALLVHSEGRGAALIGELGRAARTDRAVHGVPARVLPMAVWHTASTGIDLWLGAVALGASQVFVLVTEEEAPQYRQALAGQMAVAQAILAGLGYAGTHFVLVEAGSAAALDAALRVPPAQGVAVPASLAIQADKRATLELAIEHLLQQAPAAAESIALPAAGSPFGTLVVDGARCTTCLACVGACPAGALADNPDAPQLRFLEKNCVQCGLCVKTCPEDAIVLQPRLWLADGGRARKQLRVLNEAQPFHCIKCGKAFGTQRAVEGMFGKLAGHPMFQGAAAERLKMCQDCRVVDIFSNPNETRITDL